MNKNFSLLSIIIVLAVVGIMLRSAMKQASQYKDSLKHEAVTQINSNNRTAQHHNPQPTSVKVDVSDNTGIEQPAATQTTLDFTDAEQIVTDNTDNGNTNTTYSNTYQLPAIRKEYRAGKQLPVGRRVAAPVCADWPETGYWLSTNSNKRHNARCENYRKTRGYPCTKNEGQPCGKCGG